MQADLKRIEQIVENKDMSAVEKLTILILGEERKPDSPVREARNHFQSAQKSLFHYMLLEKSFFQTAKVIAEVVRQGIQEGVFQTESPDEMSEFVSSAVQTLIIIAKASNDVTCLLRRVDAFSKLMELCFGHPPVA